MMGRVKRSLRAAIGGARAHGSARCQVRPKGARQAQVRPLRRAPSLGRALLANITSRPNRCSWQQVWDNNADYNCAHPPSPTSELLRDGQIYTRQRERSAACRGRRRLIKVLCPMGPEETRRLTRSSSVRPPVQRGLRAPG
ncbi:hypothetical protein HPB50_000905 [Hyalomma asiaticum]|uniref:Uncharacterized protein n=1 Tax=Hyalomma asiaticum TaxID=266040 RepID=A0ACB7SAV5_HYAAI|nr:hypothetical protein HPB50_000905 [Hyalomma asiaticum]